MYFNKNIFKIFKKTKSQCSFESIDLSKSIKTIDHNDSPNLNKYLHKSSMLLDILMEDINSYIKQIQLQYDHDSLYSEYPIDLNTGQIDEYNYIKDSIISEYYE